MMHAKSTITDIKYCEKNDRDVMRICTEDYEPVYIPNGDYAADNPSLCVLASLGVSPSTIDEAVGKQIPISESGVPKTVINGGQKKLKQDGFSLPPA